MTEKWLPVVGFEGRYEVSDFGRVRSAKTGALKTPQVEKPSNRQSVLLWQANKATMVRVHRLVLFAFVGPPAAGHECCHNDGNAANNHVSNLRWDTAQSNQLDRVTHGTSNRGERCAAAKFTEAQVLAIRADPRLQREIAADYGVLPNAISRIKSHKRWGHL